MDPGTPPDVTARLDAVAQRLAEHAQAAPPTGLTAPDEGGVEQWEAGQVWAHIAEFVPYWQQQLQAVVAAYGGAPVPFGRTKTDPGRIAAIEIGRNESFIEQMARTYQAIQALKQYTSQLTPAQWSSVGMHPTRGEMPAPQIVDRFIVNHHEEHADQLDSLRSTD
jgi:hypothetical protein